MFDVRKHMEIGYKLLEINLRAVLYDKTSGQKLPL